MKTRLKFITAVVLLLIFGFTTKAQKTDFSGNWKLNADKSEFGNVPVKAAIKNYNIIQNADELSLTWVALNVIGEDATSSQKVSLTGEASAFLMPNGKTRSMAVIFSADGKTVAVSKKISKVNKPEELEYELKELWSLSADGKDLLLELTSPAYVLKLVYSRQ